MNWLVVGLGAHGVRHVTALRTVSENVAAVDADAAALAKVAPLCNNRVFTTLGGALAEEAKHEQKFHAAIVASPVAQREDIVLALTAAAPHIVPIVEAPIAHTTARHEEILAATKGRGLVTSPYRHQGALVTARKQLAAGWFGRVRALRVTHARQRTGDLFDDLAHELDLARWLLGCDPRTAYAQAISADTLTAVLDYADTDVTITCDRVAAPAIHAVDIVGEARAARVECLTVKDAVLTHEKRQIDHWMAVMSGKAEPVTPLVVGYQVAGTVAACRLACDMAEEGRTRARAAEAATAAGGQA